MDNGGFELTEGGVILLDEFKLLGQVLPAQQHKFPHPTTTLKNKNSASFLLLVTRFLSSLL